MMRQIEFRALSRQVLPKMATPEVLMLSFQTLAAAIIRTFCKVKSEFIDVGKLNEAVVVKLRALDWNQVKRMPNDWPTPNEQLAALNNILDCFGRRVTSDSDVDFDTLLRLLLIYKNATQVA